MEIRKGISWASGIALALVLGLIIFLAWSAVNKKQEVDNYGGKATHNESSVTIAPIQHGYPLSCARFEIKPDGTYTDLDRKVKK
jgi:hypothetical protein